MSFGRRLLRRWFTMMAVGAVVGGALVLSDEEKRKQLLAKARELGGEAKQLWDEQWESASPRVEEWRAYGRQWLEAGSSENQPEA
jgi:hypothetical protein